MNVSTVEDPIEMIEPSFNQTQVQAQLDFGFAEGLRALMRQDPDIIMVGEIRDLQTAEMAVQAALTGHLVFSTLHTNDAPSAISRLMELGVPAYLINATMLGVLAQRLVRTLCKQCRQAGRGCLARGAGRHRQALEDQRRLQALQAGGLRRLPHDGLHGPHGPVRAADGERSLQGKADPAPSIDVLRRQAIADGMRPLRLAGALRVAEGLTTLEEVLTATPPLE